MRRVFLAIVVANFIAGLGLAAAQTTQPKNGIIRGFVLDETRALIPGVQITLSRLDEKEVKRAISNPKGEYSFETSPGKYELKAELPGFETSSIGSITLKDGETIQVDFTLKVSGKGVFKLLQR